MPPLLELAWDTSELRDLCVRNSRATNLLGYGASENLKRHLADLRAVDSIMELPGDEVQMRADGLTCFIDLGDRVTLAFVPGHLDCPTTELGAVDWASVYRIKITAIGAVHD